MIIIPLKNNLGEDSQISAHFGHAPFITLYEPTNSKLDIVANIIDHSLDKTPVEQIIEKYNPQKIITRGMGQKAIKLFKEKGVIIKYSEHTTLSKTLNNLKSLNNLENGCKH